MRKINLSNIQVASSETARDINRRIVLNLVRSRQPVSRADIARISGLQRSTVSSITECLIADGWLIAGLMGHLPRGRRPTFLRLNTERVMIGIDIRPTKTIIATSDINAHFDYQEVFPTPPSAEEGIKELTLRLQRLMQTRKGVTFEGIGISLPGRINPQTKVLCFSPNLHWQNADLIPPLTQATGLEVELENAANACALAEVWFGPSDNIRDLVVVTVSEGIGIGVYMNGQLVRGADGMAGEFGHVTMDPNGPICGCGNRGCWETLASNRAATRYYDSKNRQDAGPNFKELLALADQGDVQAAKALDTMAVYLGRGLRMLAVGLGPAAIVLVGEVTRAWSRVAPLINKEISAYPLPGPAPRIVPAVDGEMARLRGTVALVLQKHFGASAFTDL